MIATTSCSHGHRLVIEVRSRWWGYTQTWELPLRHGPVRVHSPLPSRRYTPRPCRIQAARWKRRRFVQSLRKAAG